MNTDDMNMDEVIATLSTTDADRNFGAELADALEEYDPDDNTKMASLVIFEMAKIMVAAILALELAEIRDADNGQVALDKDGELPEEVQSSIRAASCLAAITRNEDRERPIHVAQRAIRAIFEPDYKIALSKAALDNIRKGVYAA